MADDVPLDEPLDPDLAGVLRGLAADELAWRDRACGFVQAEVLPHIAGWWERAEYPAHLVPRLGALDLLRDGVDVDGCPHQSRLAAGLATAELNRGDGSVAAIAGVQGGLVLRAIALLGSPAQQEQWLGPLARGEKVGAFALTEPAHGSDSVTLEARARPVTGGGWVLDGEKKWIGNGAGGDLTVVWARVTAGEEEGRVRGFLVPQSSPGYSAEPIRGKLSLRAIHQAHVRLDGVELAADAVLPGAHAFRDAGAVLIATRLTVAWSALGQATACYETAVHYAQAREQFGRPLAATQLVQARLARMLAAITQLQTLLVQLSREADAGRLSEAAASVAKYSGTRTARAVAADARDLLGGNGILIGNRVARHFADVEALHTFEGTESVQELLIGRHITGRSAF
ncbi:acyl-CoA dehydrogenase family protein [Gryllotalpicola ginsengisoli]|uniref:acyl-CoA dehydrogenase family protein n=1 Tax=Gryllotalpicola ginsengisoli TaxID=444608 RepID=UPI0003B6A15E|nr:acyl-CoA dehydrogenase family protein [Gryllotalpicola ginsengisoli]